MEEFLYRGNKKLKYGYTTGSCAAAASKAAAMMLLTGERVEEIFLMTPKGIGLTLPIEQINIENNKVSCAVRKDAGDDADCTHDILICSVVEYMYDSENDASEQVFVDGGVGVGRVTKPGLELPIGAAAINKVPRQMIKEAVCDVIEMCSYAGRLKVTIFVPDGEQIGVNTFNPRLGIEGGISILGTSGIVEPMSETALIQTIHAEIKMKTYGGIKELLITPGNYGRDFAKETFNIDLDKGVKCSNFIGNTIDMAYEFGLEKILLIGHIGKLVKLAAGVMNTHSRWADARMETICAAALMAGADADFCRQLLKCISTDDALYLLKKIDLLNSAMEYIMKKIDDNLNRRAYDGLRIETIVFSKVFGVLGMTNGAMDLIEHFKGA